MQHFIGTYECKADEKGRIMLPVSLKKQLSDKLKNGFVIKRAVFNSCLELYPLKEWDELNSFPHPLKSPSCGAEALRCPAKH